MNLKLTKEKEPTFIKIHYYTSEILYALFHLLLNRTL